MVVFYIYGGVSWFESAPIVRGIIDCVINTIPYSGLTFLSSSNTQAAEYSDKFARTVPISRLIRLLNGLSKLTLAGLIVPKYRLG